VEVALNALSDCSVVAVLVLIICHRWLAERLSWVVAFHCYQTIILLLVDSMPLLLGLWQLFCKLLYWKCLQRFAGWLRELKLKVIQ
jgi:hypothetical protein